MTQQVRAYLEAHPYKQDGLNLLLILKYGDRVAADLVNEIRKGEFKEANITVHVVAPLERWEEITNTLRGYQQLIGSAKVASYFHLSSCVSIN